MTSFEQVLECLRRRLAATLVVRESLAYLAVFAFAWGTVVLVCRVLWHTPAEVFWWGLMAVPLLIGLAAFRAWRRLPPLAKLRALLDRASNCGGLLLASEEQHLGQWEQAMPSPAELRWRWRAGRMTMFLGAGLVFLFASLLFPDRYMLLGADPALEIGSEVQKLAGQIEVLKKEGILEPERAETFQQKLNKLKAEASGVDPVKTLEALDHLSQLATKAASEAAESATAQTERLAKAQALAEGLNKAGAEIEPRLQKKAMSELAEMMNRAAQERRALQRLLDSEQLKNLKKGKLSAEQLKELADLLRDSKGELRELIEKLHEAKLIDAEQLKKCEEAGMCDGDAVGKCLAKGDGKKSIAQILGECQGKTRADFGGKGGVTEGPGHNPITWTQGTSEEGLKFKEETLPPGALASLKNSKLIGVGVSDPSKEKGGGPSVSGVLNPNLAGGGSANTQVVLPRHRKTVERYFDRPVQK